MILPPTEMFQLVMNTIPQFIFWKDRECVYLGCNDNFAKVAGVENPAEIVGKSDYDLAWTTEEADQFRFDDQRVMASGSPEFNIVEPQLQNDGKQAWLNTNKAPIRDAEGHIVGILGTFEDITDKVNLEKALESERLDLTAAKEKLEKANQELEASQKCLIQREKMASVGQLAAGVAHEINNPVGFINSNLNSLKKYFSKINEYQAEQQAIIDNICSGEKSEQLSKLRKQLKIDLLLEDGEELITDSIEGVESVKAIVQSLKTFSRIDEPEKQMVNINECLESTINVIWNEIKYNSELNRDFGDLPLTRGFPQQLGQVFINLIVNASHAIDKKGVIAVKTTVQNDQIIISISDNGCGIPKDNLDKIFDPFFTTKEAGLGTGLGMSIVHEIVKKHDGEIFVQSEVGKGTTFTLHLPVCL